MRSVEVSLVQLGIVTAVKASPGVPCQCRSCHAVAVEASHAELSWVVVLWGTVGQFWWGIVC